MSEIQRRGRPSREKSALAAGLAGAVYGALLGAVIGASYMGSGSTITGALVCGVIFGLGEGITDATRKRGHAKPLAWRVFGSVLTGAGAGALFELLAPGLSLFFVGLVLGALFGFVGLSRNRLYLGGATGVLLGLLAQWAYPEMNAAFLGGAITLVYRVAGTLLSEEQDPLQVVGERVPPAEARMVVPFDANTKYVGAAYFEDLARTKKGGFQRNAPGVGIVESLDCLRGPHFDPQTVDPLIREFYEHTTRFKLNIVPEWKRRMVPLFWLFKRGLAQRIGQANLPFDVAEAQRGVVSYIDTIDFDCDDIIDLRGWVRAFETTGEAIYVGVYTTFRHDDIGYVSVGFPLPGANFTATLLPYSLRQGDFILKTGDTGTPYPGHYLSFIEADTGELTVLKMPTFDEEIEVYVLEGKLRTDHRFYVSGFHFLTLYYTMERL